MHSPEIAEENEVLSALRLGRKEISHGIEKEIDELHKLSPVKRGLEFATLFLLYGTGVFLLTYPGGILPLSVCGIVCMGLAFNMLGMSGHRVHIGQLNQPIPIGSAGKFGQCFTGFFPGIAQHRIGIVIVQLVVR